MPRRSSRPEPEATAEAPKSARFEIRLPEPLCGAIDAWRRAQPTLPSRAEAARRLIEIGLKAAEGDRE